MVLAACTAWPEKPAFEILSGLEIIQQFFFLAVMSLSEEEGGEDFGGSGCAGSCGDTRCWGAHPQELLPGSSNVSISFRLHW